MRSVSLKLIVLAVLVPFASSLSPAQASPPSEGAPATVAAADSAIREPLIALRATPTIDLTSAIGGAFLPPVKCDADGNLYVRKFASNRSRGPVIKIDANGKPAAVFDPAAFAQLGLDRVDAFATASDGGLYQVAKGGGSKPRVYVLHYSSDGSPASSSHLDADFEVFTFAAFSDGNFLVSGVRRDPMDKNDHGKSVTKVFSADGRELADLSFEEPKQKARKTTGAISGAKTGPGGSNQPIEKDAPPAPPKVSEKSPGAIDLKDAELGRDGNLYVLRTSAQALIDVITPGGKIMKTFKITSPLPNSAPTAFHVSENRLALLFSNDDDKTVAIAVVEAQSGRKIATYSGSANLGTFACYAANDGVFTFLKHGEGDRLEVIRAEP